MSSFIRMPSAKEEEYHFLMPVTVKSIWNILLSSIDGNEELLPIAVGIVDSESIENCRWFLQKLRELGTPSFVAWLTSDKHVMFMDRGKEWQATEIALPRCNIMCVRYNSDTMYGYDHQP